MNALRIALLAAALVVPALAWAQEDHAAHAAAEPQSTEQSEHSAHDMSGMEGMEGMDHSAHQPSEPASPQTDHSAHAGHGEPVAADGEAIGTALPPPLPDDHPADRYWDKPRMAAAREALSKEGRFAGSALLIDRFEYRAVKGEDGYAWQASGWIGGDIDRLSFATEGEGRFGEDPESTELRAGWRHALDPWWNFELGLRQDLSAGPDRTYAVIGIKGLAPYWFEAGAHAFVSNKGDVHLRFEFEHDMRLTQRLVLQPSIELDAALQDVPELGIGAGLEKFELGARLRHEFTREFAPYVGVHWERKLGETARLTRAAGESASALSAVAGVRFWF